MNDRLFLTNLPQVRSIFFFNFVDDSRTLNIESKSVQGYNGRHSFPVVLFIISCPCIIRSYHRNRLTSSTWKPWLIASGKSNPQCANKRPD